MPRTNRVTYEALIDQFVWQIDMTPFIGKQIKIETHAGHKREAVLTEIQWAIVLIQGIECSVPTHLAFGFDDGVKITQVKSMELSIAPDDRIGAPGSSAPRAASGAAAKLAKLAVQSKRFEDPGFDSEE